jgi:hypothetical protein
MARALQAEMVIEGVTVSVQPLVDILNAYAVSDGNIKTDLLPDARHAAEKLQEMIATAVNCKAPGIRTLQTTVLSGGAIRALVHLARMGEPAGYEAMQILCYRNALVCQQIVSECVGTLRHGRGGGCMAAWGAAWPCRMHTTG